MDVDDETDKNENVGLPNVSLQKLEKSKGLRKSFIPHKKRVILQELKPISESNILEDCSQFSSKGSTCSFTHDSRQRENLKDMSESSEECANSSRHYSSAECTESELVIPETPPATLRLRIKEAQQMRVYLEKELTELQEFTTKEKQILAAEQGVKQLEEHNNQLSEQNNELQMSLLHQFHLQDLVNQELNDLKQKFVDEQTEKQILETKWKQREDDLKKSLEEAWNLLHVKEDRILKMNEKISSLYSEREKAKNLDLTFGGQFLPVNNEYNLESIDQNIAELFELSSCNFSESKKSSDLRCKDNSKGDSCENSEISKFKALQEELKNCIDSLDFNKKQLEDLHKNLANKELAISHYENNLSFLVQNISEYLSEDSICTKETCLTKIKSDIKLALSLGKSTSDGTTEKILLKNIKEVDYISDLNSCLGLGGEISMVNVSMPMEFQIKQDEEEMSSTVSDFQSSNKDVNILKANLHTVNSHSRTEVDYSTIIDNKANLISLGNTLLESEQDGKNCGHIRVSLENNVLKSEQSFNDNIENMVLEKKLLDYRETTKDGEEEINLLRTKVLYYEQTVDKVENKLSTLQEKVQQYEEKIKILEDELDKVKIKEESLGNYYVNKVATCGKTISIKSHCLNVSSQTDIDTEIMKFDQEKLISLEEQDFYTEKNKQQNEETLLLLQNQIIDYEDRIQNSTDELSKLQRQVSDYAKTVEENEARINELQNFVSDNESLIKNNRKEIDVPENNVSGSEEKYKKSEEEINRLQNIGLINEQTINTNKKEIVAMQNKIKLLEESVKNYEEEKDTLLNKVSSYEETIANSREELNTLQKQISDFSQTINENEEKIGKLQCLVLDNESSIKNKINEISLLENNICDYEEKFKKNEEEINRLQNIIVLNDQTINKEEIVAMQNNIKLLEESVKNYEEEKDTLSIKVSSYEETIASSREELNTLQKQISDFSQTINENEEKIGKLQCLVLDNESSIKNKISEISQLEKNICDYEEKFKKNEEEINRLENIIVVNGQTINKEEIVAMQNKIKLLEGSVNNYEEEKDTLLIKVSSYEETIASSREELNTLQKQTSDFSQTINENEEKIGKLQCLVLDNESSIKNKISEISQLEKNICDYEEKFKKNEEEINRLENIIVVNGQTINKEEIVAMQNKIKLLEESVNNYEEEKDTLLIKVSSYEETIASSREELNTLQKQTSDFIQIINENEEKIGKLQCLVLDNESSIKNKISEISQLEKNICDYEEKFKKNEEEINRLENIIVVNGQTIDKEEIVAMQNKIKLLEESVNNYEEEKDTLLNKVSSYEETIASSREELNTLQKQTSDFIQIINENEEKIGKLQCLVLDNESSIKNKISEISQLEKNICDYEEKFKKNEEEINRLENIIVVNGQTINKEEIVAMQNKIKLLEGSVNNYEEEKDTLLIKVSSYEETIASSREELNTLQKQTSDFSQTINENEEKIGKLQCLFLDNESSIKNKISEISQLEKNICDYEEKFKKNEEEINRLENIIVVNGQTINKEEIVAMQNKIKLLEESVNNYEEEKDTLLIKVSSYEETIASSREELNTLQKQTSDFIQIINENEEKIGKLQCLVLDNESSIKNKISEISQLEKNICDYEEKFKKNEEEINRLENIIVVNGQTIDKEEIVAMQNKIKLLEESVNNYEEEKDTLLNKVSSYEETIASSREELNTLQKQTSDFIQIINENEEKIGKLQCLVLDNESSIKNKISEISQLEKNICDYEEKFMKNEEEINRLQNIIEVNGQTIDKEEIVAMQNNIKLLEESVKNYEEEKDTLLNKVSSYEEAIANSREELNTLQKQISDFSQTINDNEEKIGKLQCLVLDNESLIKNKISEISQLEKNICGYEEKFKKNEEEINRLQNVIVVNGQTIIKEEMEYKKTIEQGTQLINSLQNEISDKKNAIKINEEEICALQEKVSYYENAFKNNRDEIEILKKKKSEYEEQITILQSKVNDYQQIIHNNKEEISLLKNISDSSELELTNRFDALNQDSLNENSLQYNLAKTVDYNDIFDNTSTISGMGNLNKTEINYSTSSYSQNPFAVVRQNLGTTLNSSTLDSLAQLEQSVLISKLPQSDYSVREYDPLASIVETSFLSKEYDANELPENISLNQKYIKINSDDKIKALLSLLNDKLDGATFDKICEQFSIVQGMLDPTEDYVIYSFCEIIKNLLYKEITSKKYWNDKMVLVNDTLINFHNIKDDVLELKNSCFSLQKITSQDFEIINSQLKNLFSFNKELFAENEQLKDNLKVSLLSEERLSSLNEILKNELSNVLDYEKELHKAKECNSKLMVELNNKCIKENDINLLVEKIENLLDPTFSWPADSLYSKLEQIHFTIINSIHHEHDHIQLSGLLPFLKNLLIQNNSFKNMIEFNVNNLKDSLLLLKPDISYLCTNVNSDLHTLSKKLSELNEKQHQETVSYNELKENFENLVLENTKLKGELHDLKTSNENLKITSKDYDILLDKYKNLQEFVEENDKVLNDYFLFKEDVCLFINNLKDLYIIEEFKKIDSTCKFTSKSDSLNFLLWLQKFLEEIHNIREYLLQNIQASSQYTISECIEELCREKIKCNDAFNSLGNYMKNTIHLYSENLIGMKGTLELISADIVNLKHSFIDDLACINHHVDNILLVSDEKEAKNEKDKSDFRAIYDLLNEKYSELVVSYEVMKTELQQKENVIEELMAEKDKSMKKNTLLESQNAELNEMISKFDKEIPDYKNLCLDLERKIIDVESKKEKVEEHLKQYGTLVEYNVLKLDQIKLHKLLNILNTSLKECYGDELQLDADHFEECLSVLTTTFDRLYNERNKYDLLELQCANLIAEKDEQLKQIAELNDIIKETKKNMDNEIQTLLTKEESNRIYFEETHNRFAKKLTDILTLLDYQECTKIDEVAWTFILNKICHYKLMFDKNNEFDVMELKDKIMSLEAQLSDARDFKTKFSIELHSLKPDLDVSYLMTLSLADLQKTMIMAIIEKEKDVIADYEMKLISNTDKIQQLEEQEKRRVYWVQEIEKENDRLVNECKQIQDANEILKSDIKSKVDTINDLENQIMQRVSIVQMNESIREKEESINQLEVAVNEKQTLQLTLASLNEKLKEKSKECEEMYSCLEKKAEIIFNLEKILSKCTLENAILEKEVHNLREPNLYSFNENDVNSKLQIEQCNKLLDSQEADLKDVILQKKTETITKSLSTDQIEIGQVIKGSFNDHSVKLELFNTEIAELKSQLKLQSDKFDEELENQTKLIKSLQKELDLANGLNAELKNNNAVIEFEKLKVELNEFKEQNNVLENEKVLLLKEKEALERLLAIHSENEESSLDHMRMEIEILQNKLCEEQNIKIQMQEQVEKMICELQFIKNELASSEEAKDKLLQQTIEAEKYKEEIKSIAGELEYSQIKIKELILEKEKSLSEYFNNLKLEKEINATIKTKLEETRLELLNLKNEKDLFMEDYHKNVQSERDMCSILNSDLLKMKELNRNLESDLLVIKKELGEKETQLEEIKTNCHLEEACPYKKEVVDISSENKNLSKQLEHELQTFELWKTNLEEDLHCKLLKISDLESKLNKETQCYKEAVMTNSELNQLLLESQEKLKKLEDKLAMQRDVFIRDKSKLEIDIQSKDALLKELEGKLGSVKYQCEEFSKDICVFLQKFSDLLKEDVTDLASAIALLSKQILEKQSLMEELKEAQEKAEQLEEECEVLNGDIKYHENVIGNLFEKNKMQEEKWISEKKEFEMYRLKSKELLEKINTNESIILSLQTEIEKYEKSLKNAKEDKKAVELEKLELEGKIVDLERNLNSFKNQEISCTDGIKQELNRLKLELVSKHKMISKLEMRLESDTLPFQKKAELAEKKVEELTKELRLFKQTQSFQPLSSVVTSPITGLDASSQLLGAKEKMIEKLQQDIKQLITEKSALKLLAQNRRIQIKELQEQLGKRNTGSFYDVQTPI